MLSIQKIMMMGDVLFTAKSDSEEIAITVHGAGGFTLWSQKTGRFNDSPILGYFARETRSIPGDASPEEKAILFYQTR